MKAKAIAVTILIWVIGSFSAFVHAQQMQFSDLEYPYPVEYQKLDNGQKIAYIDEGSGMPVILIHGLGSYIPAWKQNIPKLAEQHRVIALDLPGYGKSSKKVSSYSIKFFAETVAQLQDSLGIKNAVWGGHSMGGQVALRGALEYPRKIIKLVLAAPAGFETYTDQQAKMLGSFVTPASVQNTTDKAVQTTFKTTFYDFSNEAQFMIDDRLAIRDAPNFDQYARAYAQSVQAMLDGPVFSELHTIEKPTLIVFGRQDALIPNKQLHPQLTPKKVAESGHSEMPNSTLHMIDEAGHFVHFEQAKKVNDIISKFLNGK